MRALPIALSLVLAALLSPAPAHAQDYKVVSTLQAQGSGSAQALAIDSSARRLYSGRSGGVDVYDIDSGSKVASFAVDGNVGGIALATDLGRGYVTSSDTGTLRIFDLSSLQVVATVQTGGSEPREVSYDAKAGLVYVSNARSGNLVALDPRSGSRKGAVTLGGRLRQASADGRGHLFVADEARDVLHVVQTPSLKSLGSISVWPGKGPTALANDVKERRIYVSTANSKMIVVDPDSGQMLSVVNTTGTSSAGVAIQYAPARLVRLFMPNTDGTLDVVQNAKLTPSLETSVPQVTAGTAVAFDEASGRAFVAGPEGIQVIGK
jgi:DNA-binding beta-propeller fold protein YncE